MRPTDRYPRSRGLGAIRLEGYRPAARRRPSAWGTVAVWLALGAMAVMVLNVAAMVAFRPPSARTDRASAPAGAPATIAPGPRFQPPSVAVRSPTPASSAGDVPSPPSFAGAAGAAAAPVSPARAPSVLGAEGQPGHATETRARPETHAQATLRTAAGTRAAAWPPAPGGASFVPAAPPTAPDAAVAGDALRPGASSAPQVAEAAPARRYHVQAGTFGSREEADLLSARLRRLGYACRVVGAGPFLVYVGGFLDEATAAKLLASVRSHGFNAGLSAGGGAPP